MKDLSGLRFNCLTVTEFSHVDGNSKAMWVCQCDCGKKTLGSSSALINGQKKSCGHLRSQYLKRMSGPREKPQNKIMQWSKDGYGWDIDEGLEELGVV